MNIATQEICISCACLRTVCLLLTVRLFCT